MNDFTGSWSGMMFDAEGGRARGSLELKGGKGEIKGSSNVTVIGEHSGIELKGKVRGKYGKGGTVTLIQEFKEAGIRVVFEGRGMALKTHAEASLYGTYQVEGRETGDLAGGVAIFWRYRARK